MEKLRCAEVLEATGGVLLSGDKDTLITGISTDSRKVLKGELFVPIMGENFNGHDFIGRAFENGAEATLTEQEYENCSGHAVIKVEDTLKALGKIAAYYRKKYDIPIIAVTGSVGKTGTKDMIASILAQKYNVMKTIGNFNNEIGLPLTILQLDAIHKAAVVEMGMSGPGEIARLSKIAKPDISVITNIGISHIEKLGSKENILKAKMEILEGMDAGKGLLILNADDVMLKEARIDPDIRKVYFGIENDADVQAENISISGNTAGFDIKLGGTTYKALIPVPGRFNVYNALAAIAAALELKIEPDSIIRGLSLYQPGSMRMNIEKRRGYTIINDAYNASPDSVRAAIDVLVSMDGSRKIAVLGDMLELGEWAEKAHAEIGAHAYNTGVDVVIGVGGKGSVIAEGAKNAGMDPRSVHIREDNADATGFLKGFIQAGDVILIKGSRGMKMELIDENLQKEISNTEGAN